METNTWLWILAVVLVLIGVAGTLLPVLPGAGLVFAGLVLAAWIDGFQKVGWLTIALLGVLTGLAMLIDFLASLAGAKRMGASKLALLGASIGAVVGLFFGLIAVFIGPFIGAVIGELIHRGRLRDMPAAAKVGLGTWLGLLLGALAKLVEREAQSGKQLLDRVKVRKGYEKALGAALADDLRAPELTADKGSGWAVLPGYREAQSLPDGVQALSDFVTVPEVLIRRIGQIGLVARGDGARLQAALKPGQRLVSLEGDVWRWDGFRAAAEDAPSAAALRLQQLNRLVELKRDLEEVAARAEGARQAHDLLTRRLAQASEADRQAREARREADRRMAEASRALSRAEADRSIAGGKLCVMAAHSSVISRFALPCLAWRNI